VPRNVLIATSHIDIANSLRLGLEVSNRYNPQIAQSGSEAISRVKQDEYDLIILDSDMTEDLLAAAWRNICNNDSGPKLVVIGRGGVQQNPAVLDQLKPAYFFHYPVYLPEFLDYLDDLLTMKPTTPSFSSDNRQPISTPTLPWLGNFDTASNHLLDQFFATSADAALIYLSGVVCALAGSMEKAAAFQVAEVLLSRWDEENPADLARFITVGEQKQEYFLYATILSGSSVLCCLYAPDISLSQSRAHTHELRRNLLANSPSLPSESLDMESLSEEIPDLEADLFESLYSVSAAEKTAGQPITEPETLLADLLFDAEFQTTSVTEVEDAIPELEEEIEPLTLAELFKNSPSDETEEDMPYLDMDLKSLLEHMPSPIPDQPEQTALDSSLPDNFDDIGLVFPWEREQPDFSEPEHATMEEPEAVGLQDMPAPANEPASESPVMEWDDSEELGEDESVFAQILAQSEFDDDLQVEWRPPLEEEELQPAPLIEALEDGPEEALFFDEDDFSAFDTDNSFWEEETQPIRVNPPQPKIDLHAIEQPIPAEIPPARNTSPLRRLQRVLEDKNGMEDTQPIRVRPSEPAAKLDEELADIPFPWEVESTSLEPVFENEDTSIMETDASMQATPPFDLSSFREENDDVILYDDEDALFTIVLTPQNERHIINGLLAENMRNWISEVCVVHQWELRSISVQPAYVLMTILAQPTMTSAFVINTLRNHTSRRLFNSHPNVKKELRSNDFWAASHLVFDGDHQVQFDELLEFVEKAQRDQKNWFDTPN
jgi:REP element-mobilizing transposase RayT/CheY-like chemotaxis protein